MTGNVGRGRSMLGWLICRVLSLQFCVAIFICRMCQQAQILRTVSLQRVRSTGHQLPIHKISMHSCPAPSFERFWDHRSGEPISIVSHSHLLETIISRTLLMFYTIKPTNLSMHMYIHLHFNLTYMQCCGASWLWTVWDGKQGGVAVTWGCYRSGHKNAEARIRWNGPGQVSAGGSHHGTV